MAISNSDKQAIGAQMLARLDKPLNFGRKVQDVEVEEEIYDSAEENAGPPAVVLGKHRLTRTCPHHDSKGKVALNQARPHLAFTSCHCKNEKSILVDAEAAQTSKKLRSATHYYVLATGNDLQDLIRYIHTTAPEQDQRRDERYLLQERFTDTELLTDAVLYATKYVDELISDIIQLGAYAGEELNIPVDNVLAEADVTLSGMTAKEVKEVEEGDGAAGLRDLLTKICSEIHYVVGEKEGLEEDIERELGIVGKDGWWYP